MLRGLALSLLALSLLAGPAAARGDGPGGGRGAEAKASGSAKAEQQRSPLLRRVLAADLRPGAPSSGSACGRTHGKATRCRASGASRGWAQGLPPPLLVQARECPTGTMATLAEGHDDIVRCIPF